MNSIVLRDYQTDIIERLSEAWERHKNVMVQMPTGTGKTHVLASVVNRLISGNAPEDETGVWIVAHRRELVAQIEETLLKYDIRTGTGDRSIKVMSIQWMARHWKELEDRPALIIIDEAHHALAETYMELWRRYPETRKLGMTATPCRMNRKGFTGLFDTLLTSWSIAEFIRKGELSLFDYVSIRTDSEEQLLIDSLEKRGTDGDYQTKEMNAALNRRPNIERLYRSMEQFAHGKKGIVYAICIDHARQIAAYYHRMGLSTAVIDSRTPTAERKRRVAEFRQGPTQVLVNVDVFSEGFDCPDVEFVQMARPTLSLSKYLQQVGRGLRKAEGKEACVLIDNVGLYRVFGLPTSPRDWEAMFRGEQTGKGIRYASQQNNTAWGVMPAGSTTLNNEMEMVVSRQQLLSALAEPERPCSPPARKAEELKAWQEEQTGLQGLKRGLRKITAAMFTTVFDIRYDMAAVRFTDNTCGLVNGSGEIIWSKRHYQSMKFTRDYFLTVRLTNGQTHYVDLHNLRTYDNRPEIKRCGKVELLKTGGTYYSRTRNRYMNNQRLNGSHISDHRFYTAIFDYKVPESCHPENPCTDGYRWGYACLFPDDCESFYWIYRRLADGSIIVTDDAGRFYHAAEHKEKEYIGCRGSAEEETRCQAEIECRTHLAQNLRQALATEQAEKRRRYILNYSDEAIPFRSGMKWGLKVGNQITVPPIYRSIKSPVGRYCAVEKSYSQWGVMTLDGTWIIEPQYSDIEINDQGVVTGTKATGNKVRLQLP
ncbi:MAG: DEAD/DEAH box helicase [Paraprevotella sp.]|nr:DEAD/DEAH box helicase [Paraprevotella sp.]